MEGDYLELSQFSHNPHPFPYNSLQSPLGTTGFLTSAIKAVDLEMSNCDQRKLLKEIQQMLKQSLRRSQGYFKEDKGLG